MIIRDNCRYTFKVIGVINKDIIKKIGEKEMDRMDFLKYSGLALVAVAGLKTITNFISQPDNQKIKVAEAGKDSKRGFGSGKYGV